MPASRLHAVLDAAFRDRVRGLEAGEHAPDEEAQPLLEDLHALLTAQVMSRELDSLGHDLAAMGEGWAAVGSTGQEADAAVALALRPTDPALLDPTSGAFYCARAGQVEGVDPVASRVHSLTGSIADPASGGRTQSLGHPALAIVPTSGQPAGHLPRAMGLAFGLPRATRLGVTRRWPVDAVVVASFTQADLGHTSAVSAFNAAAQAVRRGVPVPLLLVCKDDSPGPRSGVARRLQALPGITVETADGTDPVATLEIARRAVDTVRRTRRPVCLHLRTAPLGEAPTPTDLDGDPLLATARALVARGWDADRVLAVQEEVRSHSLAVADQLLMRVERLRFAYQVMGPLTTRRPAEVVREARGHAETSLRREVFGGRLPEEAGPLTAVQSLTAALTELMARRPDTLLMGQGIDAATYDVTRGLAKLFGPHRVFDTGPDEQSVISTALGTALAGFLPIARLADMAALHGVQAQLRGEAATLGFLSKGQVAHGMLLCVPALARGEDPVAHLRHDNSLAVLRDVPGLVVACPSSAAEVPGLVRALTGLATVEHRVCVLVEPIPLLTGEGEPAPYAPPTAWVDDTPELGATALHGTGGDVLVVGYGHGLTLAREAVERARVDATLLDLRWLAPLPMADVVAHAQSFPRVLVVDETRRSGGVSEGVVAGLVDSGYRGRVDRVAARDSLVPFGPAATSVLLTVDDVVRALRR